MDKKIYLIRHGKIDFGNVKKYIGITDLLLDHTGIEQAYDLKRFFQHITIDKVYTSPLKRCLQTSKIICEDKEQDIIVANEFAEINMGLWENKPIESIKKNFPKSFEERGINIASFIPPEGESFQQLSDRVLFAFDSIMKNDFETIIIVAHAGVNRVLLSHIFGNSLQNIFNIQQPYACVNEIIFNDENSKWQYKQLIVREKSYE